MSRYNEVYAEIKIDNKWYSLNPIIKDEKTGEFKINPIIWGQSWLTPFFSYASENGTGLPDDLSDELNKIIKPNEYVEDYNNKKIKRKDYYASYYAVIDFYSLFNIVKDENKYQYNGFVDDKEIKMYEESNEYKIENYYPLESFLLLTDKKRKRLRYYEWDDYSYDSIYPYCKEIIRIVTILKRYFFEYAMKCYFNDNKNYEIRLIVYGS